MDPSFLMRVAPGKGFRKSNFDALFALVIRNLKPQTPLVSLSLSPPFSLKSTPKALRILKDDRSKYRNSFTVLLLSPSVDLISPTDLVDCFSFLLSQTLSSKLFSFPFTLKTNHLEVQNVTGSRFPQSCLSLLLGLSIGSILAFLLSNPGSSSLLPLVDTLIVLVSYTTATVIIPFSSILLSEILILRTNSNSILFPSLLFLSAA